MAKHMKLPKKIFFTGALGSKWSSIAQVLESVQGFNTTDRTPEREYNHYEYSGHKGAYFGTGMEFETNRFDTNKAWADPTCGTKLVKSHEWAHELKAIADESNKVTKDWIMLVYRPTITSAAWWHQAGGFSITYPNYDYYKDSSGVFAEIERQNNDMLHFAYDEGLRWQAFDDSFMQEYFEDKKHDEIQMMPDILVAMWTPT